jgi:putative ABC transport system permease protein
LEALWANRLRSLLTGLGIFIGVAAVIAALTLTQGASAGINSRIASLGTNSISVFNGSANNGGAFGAVGTTQSLTSDDAAALAKIPHVTGISPIVTISSQVVYGNQNWNTRVQGVDTSFQDIQSWQMAEGTWFSKFDESAGSPVALLGQTVVHSLFDASGAAPLGQTIRIRNQLFRVIGVLQSKGTQGASNQDDVVFVPFTTAITRLKNSTFVDQIEVQVDDSNNVDQVQQLIKAILEQRHRITDGAPDDFRSFSSNQLLQTAQQFTSILTLLLVGIASISLTVGGIGIMNIMLVSVTERTREIGIRMAVGARQRDIRNQFLIEALTLSLVGGAIGMILGLLIGFFVTQAAGLPFVVSVTSILLPFIVSTAIGIVFGLYPAVRASKLDPIVALRSE